MDKPTFSALSKNFKVITLGLLASGVYFLLANLGLFLASLQRNASPVWPASGFAVFLLFRYGLIYWPAIFLGAVLSNWLAPTPFLVSLGIAFGNCSEGILGAVILKRFLANSSTSPELRRAGAIVGSALVAGISSAVIGSFCLVFGGLIPLSLFSSVAWTWYIGDSIGILFVTPLLAVFSEENLKSIWLKISTDFFKIFILFSFGAALAYYLFLGNQNSLPYVGIHLLLLVAVLFLGRLELNLLALMFACVSIAGVYLGFGIFQSGTLNQNLVSLQLFLSTVALTTIVLGALKELGPMKVVGAVLIFSWIIVGFVSRFFSESESSRDFEHFNDLISKIEESLHHRSEIYENLLDGGIGLFSASKSVERNEWKYFVERAGMRNGQPGILGFGVVYPVERREEKKFLRQARADDYPEFKIHDVKAGAVYDEPGAGSLTRYVIKFVEPENVNGPAIGLDLGSEGNRRNAADKARDTGRLTITSKISLVQQDQNKPGALLYLPMYKKGARIETIEERRKAHLAWIYAPMRLDVFFEDSVNAVTNEIDFRFQEDGSSGYLVDRFNLSENKFKSEKIIKIAQHEYHVEFARSPNFKSAHDTLGAWVTMAGSIVAVLLALVVSGLENLGIKSDKIVKQKTKELSAEKEKVEVLNLRLEIALQDSSIGVWEWDILKNALFWDDQMFQIYGLKKDSITLNFDSWLKFLHPEDLSFAQESMRQAINGKSEFEPEFRVVKENGEIRYVMARGKVIRDSEGNAQKLVGINWDITKIKLNERSLENANRLAMEASEAKAQFLANMSHEIRTPINGILGMTSLLMDSSLTPEQREFSENIKYCGDSLLSLVNDVLDISKIEAGRMDLELADFDLGEMIAEIDKSFQFMAKAKGLSFVVFSALDQEKIFRGDSGRIRQILVNLIGNAIKFTIKGNVSVRVKILDKHEGHCRIRFEVTDMGVGIPPPALDRMFKAFSQVDSSVTRRFGGTGLGLSISKQLVNLMGGEIGVQSVEGAGSTFWFHLNLQIGNSQIFLEKNDHWSLVRANVVGSPKKILLAEDNIMNQKVAVKQLELMGYRVDAVANGMEVLDILRSVRYDLILMDCQMPDLDGYETTRRIRASKSMSAKSIPIIAMTANAVAGDREHCLAAGMNDYMSKPFRPRALAEMLVKWLDHTDIASEEAPQSDNLAEQPLNSQIIAGLIELDGGSTNFLKELGEMLIKNTTKNIPEIRSAWERGDTAKVVSIAHQMKSSSGNFGAMVLSGLWAEFELRKDWTNRLAIENKLMELESEFSRVKLAFQVEIEKLSS